jgi:BRCA1-associated protein
MQLGSQRVWNYFGDNYVHRLIQNKSDGKLVEVEGNMQQELADEKIDSLTLEYTHMLTSQLDSQRLYFEEKMARMEKEALDQVPF